MLLLDYIMLLPLIILLSVMATSIVFMLYTSIKEAIIYKDHSDLRILAWWSIIIWGIASLFYFT